MIAATNRVDTLDPALLRSGQSDSDIEYTVEPPNNGHVGDEHFVHCSEVVPSSEVEMYGQLMAGGKQFVHCREVVLLSECPLLEVLLYTII